VANSLLLASHLREKAVWYLCKWIGKPYKWGGDDFSGFDCSGLMHEVLQGVGIEQRGFDCAAHELYELHKSHTVAKGYAGCLVFWFRNNRAIHVEMMIDDRFVVGASGGGSGTLTEEDAIRENAYIKMDPLTYRGTNFKIMDPFKGVV